MRNNNSNMQFSTHRRSLYWLLGLCLLLLETGSTYAQNKRASRVSNSRSIGTNVKPTSSTGLGFDCPEEFGYYPHPTDCTQYFVCVFGGALLESCTGGLMYSHELQTCDWPRNVGCELVDSGTSATSSEAGGAPLNKPQHVPSRIRFGSAFTSPAAIQKTVTVPPQYHRSPPQTIQAQVQHLPPPPELPVPPNPVITSRGQPKSLVESQEEIAKLYAEAHETLPSVQEDDGDRQQRVYRGQPSTVNQVQRDRDGILHQANINAIPNHGKIGSYTFGSAYSESWYELETIVHELSHNRLNVDRGRRRRDINGLTSTTPPEAADSTEISHDSNTSSEVLESESTKSTELGSGEGTNRSNNSNNSQEQYDEAAPSVAQALKYSAKIRQIEHGFSNADSDDNESVEDMNDTNIAESMRSARQLRPYPNTSSKWPAVNYRSIDSPVHQPYPQKNGYAFGNFNPYLTPPSQQSLTNQNYNKLNPGYKAYHQQTPHQSEPVSTFGKRPTLIYTGYNLSLPPPPLEDDFRPIAGNYYNAGSTRRPGYDSEATHADLLPFLIQQLRDVKERRKQIQAENFAYFHLDNQPISPIVHTTTQRPLFDYYSTTKPTQQVTPNSHYVQYSTMGGFYNNKQEYTPSTSNYSGKLISQYSISQNQDIPSTTESNYFMYNIIANQKMKGVHNTAKLNQIEQAAVKIRPPVSPNFNIVAPPDLAYKKPSLQEVPFRDLSNFPVGITYASNSTLPESYQTFTKSISTTVAPKLTSAKPSVTPFPHKTDFQFNINEFMATLKASDLASFNPAVNPLIKYFKQVSNNGSGNIRNAFVVRRPLSASTTSRPPTSSRPILKSIPVSTRVPMFSSPLTPTTPTPLRGGFETFVNNIQNQISKQTSNSNKSATTTTTRPKPHVGRTTTTEKPNEYYDEDYEDGVDEDMAPPSQMPPYMPMSETMSPPRPQVTTNVPITTTTNQVHINLQTGYIEATTTRRPFPNFTQLTRPSTTNGVPAFISFPSDIFQELKQRLPNIQGTTSTDNQTTHRVRTTTMNTTMVPSPTMQTKIRYTVRPHRTRGQQKWQPQVQNNSRGLQNEASRGAAYVKPTIINHGSLGDQNSNLIQVTSNPERQRVESSSPSSLTAQAPDNIFVQPSSQASQPQFASNRHYYNTSIFNHGGGYQTPQQAQQQPQPSPFQQPQQQQQQQHRAPALSNHYDSSYYSVYDDDIGLYRDIEYQQQQDQHQQKPQQFQSTVRQQQQQSTYRPLEILTTPPPQRPSYNSQPTLKYDPDYDEDLNAQIEEDNTYDHPTPPPQRAEEVTIRILESKATVETSPNPAGRPDLRNYYDTFTTPNGHYGEVDYSSDYYQSEPAPLRNSPSTQSPKPINKDDYYLIANDVVQSTSAFKIDQNKKYTTIKPTHVPSLHTSSVSSRNANKIDTTTTQPVSKLSSSTKTTTTRITTLQPSSSKAHANKKFKQNVIIKLKTTTTPRTTQSPRTTAPTTSTMTPPPTLPTYNSNPFLKSRLQILAKSLISIVAGSQDQNNDNNKNLTEVHKPVTSSTQTVQSWAMVNDSADSSSQRLTETRYDESQNVRVETAERHNSQTSEASTSPKFLDFINAEAYGSGNLVHTSTQKPSTATPTNDNSPTGQSRNKRIQNYVLSDMKPQSFRLAATDVSSQLQNGQSNAKKNKEYEYSLDSGLRGFSLTAKESFNEDNVSEPLFERPYSSQQIKTDSSELTSSRSTTTVTQIKNEYNDIPTTYAPLRIWRNGRPTIMQAHNRVTTISTLSSTDLNGSNIKLTSPGSIKALGTSTERANAVNSFTARANLFKSNFSRVTSNPGMRFVSPYKSLESLLQDERLAQNNLRTTARTRYGNVPGSASSLQTTPKSIRNYLTGGTFQKNTTQIVIETMANGNTRNFSISDAILSTLSPQRAASGKTNTTITTTPIPNTNETMTETTLMPTILEPSVSTVVTSSSIQVSEIPVRPRGRSRYTAATLNYNFEINDEPTTYAPKFRIANSFDPRSSTTIPNLRRKVHRSRIFPSRQTVSEPSIKSREKYESYKAAQKAKENLDSYQVTPSTAESVILLQHKLSENEANTPETPRAEALIAQNPVEVKQDNNIEQTATAEVTSRATDASPVKYLYSNKYRQQTAERTLAESLQNAGYIKNNDLQTKFRNTNVLEQLQHFLAASDSDESGSPQFVDEISGTERKALVNEIKPAVVTSRNVTTTTSRSTTTSLTLPTTRTPLLVFKPLGNPSKSISPSLPPNKFDEDVVKGGGSTSDVTSVPSFPSTMTASPPVSLTSPSTTRVSRVNSALKSSIAAAAGQHSNPTIPSISQVPGGRHNKFQYGLTPNSNNNQHNKNNHNNNNSNNAAVAAASAKCSDSTLSPKCNEIPSRNNNRNRGSTIYTNQDRDVVANPNRGTHPPRTRPTLKPAGTIVSKAQEFVDIYKYPPSRPDPLYPQPTPDKTAAKCRKDVCLLPDCYCGGKDIPGGLNVSDTPQIVLMTFDDAINTINIDLYDELLNNKTRKNPNGCPWRATFYISHEWTDYGMVQDMYSEGHEMASHTVSHSFGEQFSQKKWTREIAGQREILAAYGGVKLSDVRGMRAPFLSVGGNKMYKMLYDSNFTYDSSMPVYENRPPSWPYTLDYKIFHDCMIPPCPTRSYPGVWQVPMVMWQDLNGGRCSMGDACSNPSDAEGVTKMIMKNFERHYTTNRAPFGLFYHAAWFTQPHHKEGFIKFLDAINAMPDVWIITNWQALQWVRDPTPISRINSFQPFQCDYSDRPKRCNNPKVCNLWHKSGVRYMKTCQPCPDIYPWTGKSGIRSSRIDNEVEEPSA